ncbi:MAG: hypothetical protein IPL52_07620 [Flavobacteriales bacterium]|nr:hypothetical protein [Flavobacteriales bacterium]
MSALLRTHKKRTRRKRQPDELLVRLRGRLARTVALQWRDGAGELHYERLTAAQSWPFLQRQ